MRARLHLPRGKAARIAGLVLGCVLLLLAFLVGTTAGARFVVARALTRVPAGVTVDIARIDGRLLGPLSLEGVRIGNRLVEVMVDSVGLDWSPRRLLNRQLHIEKVAIDGVDARLLPPPPGGYPRQEGEGGAKPPPEMPLEIVITEARAANVKLLVTESVEFRDLRVSLRGRADRYELDVATRLVGDGLPEIGLTAAATGTLADISLVPLEVRALGGVARVRAHATWYPTVAWAARATVDSLQPGLLLADPGALPGHLGARLRSEGRVEAALPTGWASLDTLEGNLLDRVVTGTARAEWTGVADARLRADVAWGPVIAALQAALTDSVAAQLAVTCDDLAGLVAGLGGRGALDVHAAGPRAAPTLTGDLLVQDFTRAEPALAIAAVEGGFHLELADLDTIPTGNGRLRLRADSIRLGQARLDSVVVTLAGTQREQRARLVVEGEPLHAHLALGGAWDAVDSTWAGAIDTLSLANPLAGSWRLGGPAALRAGPRAAALDSLRLVQDAAEPVPGGARLRLDAAWDRGDAPGGLWNARADLAGLPLALANAQLAAGQSLRGTASAAVSADGEGTTLRGTFEAALHDAGFLFEAAGRPDSLLVETASVTGSAGPADINARLAAAVVSPRSGGRAELAADLVLPGAAQLPIAPDSLAVRATIAGRVSDLAFIDGLSPLITASRGQVDLDAQVDGRLPAPAITGQLRVRDMATTLPDLGITIADVQLTARGDVTGGYALDGSARSGEGTLAVGGHLPPKLGAGTPLVVTLRGKRFQGIDTPEIQVLVSPDLELVCDGKRLDVRGTVDLPVVEVEMVEMPEAAVPPTRDAVVVDAATKAAAPAIDTWVDVKVNLGEQVRFRGFAMAIGLAGALHVRQHVPELPDCRGDLRVREGYYRAYGQDLDLDSGIVSFVGPVDDPALNIRAYRETPDGVVAGVIVTGSALAPVLKVYSEPALPETQAISYLLTGRPLDSGSGDDKARVAATAALMGSNVLSSQLGSRIGLDEARVETGGSLDQAALVTGKYLTPELYLSYAMGLFDRSNLVRLRYIMSPKWSVQTETGTTMGADLLYKIERGGVR
ncbi:MAG: translocation/assembly module TamB domain-containing protein [bacterium]|nr:translocation/assembly module TamB domain-containing protein [bacterium]